MTCDRKYSVVYVPNRNHYPVAHSSAEMDGLLPGGGFFDRKTARHQRDVINKVGVHTAQIRVRGCEHDKKQ